MKQAERLEGVAYLIRYLLSHSEIAKRLGENGHPHVKGNFLVTRNLKHYVTLFLLMANAA
jgi:trehalose synthase